MGNSQSKQKKAPLEQFDVILQLLAKRGVLPDAKVTDDARRAAMQKRLRDSYHNTELLLKNYRDLAWMVECFPDAVAKELDQPFESVDELLNGIEISSTFGQRKMEKRLAGLEKTRLMLDRVNEALTVLKRKPGNGQILYDLIYLTYIVPEILAIQEIQYRLDISCRSYYRLKDQAINLLSLRLWGSPNSTVDLWLELIMISES